MEYSQWAKQIGGLMLLYAVLACQTTDNSALVGEWKLYAVKYAGKDISKSSDPHFENGISFGKEGQYLQFGNAVYRDTGTYRLEGERLYIYAQQDTLWGTYDLSGDTLELHFPLGGNQFLDMALYRLEKSPVLKSETVPELQSSD